MTLIAIIVATFALIAPLAFATMGRAGDTLALTRGGVR